MNPLRVLVASAALLYALPLAADAKVNPWASVTTPSAGTPRSLGEYSAGCLRGAATLPLDGQGYQVMHPSRLRYYGHPDLVSFIETLGRALHTEHVGDVLVGDLSQPRGGPAPGGHSSHQTGLDVDLWFWQPKAAEHGPLSREDRESLKSRSVLDGKGGIQPALRDRVLALLRLTAADTRVSRIFVSPVIKKEACAATSSDRTWLRKVRPWYGHDDHLHVRLSCPDEAQECIAQLPVPAGDGCSELDWWFSPEAQGDRKKGLVQYQAKVGRAPGMPPECRALLDKTTTNQAPPPKAAEAAPAAPAPLQAAATTQ